MNLTKNKLNKFKIRLKEGLRQVEIINKLIKAIMNKIKFRI